MRGHQIDVVDAQVHPLDLDRRASPDLMPFDRDAFTRTGSPIRPSSSETLLDAMSDAGVGAAVLVTPTYYGWDNSHAIEIATAHPGRFRVMALIDHTAADVADRIERWSGNPLAAGVRMMILSDAHRDQLRSGAFHRYLAAAARFDVPVAMFCPRYLDDAHRLVGRHPDVRFILDMFGLGGQVPGIVTYDDLDLSSRLPLALRFADFPNVDVKAVGGPSLAALPHPFDDLWPILDQFVAAFGVDRMLWGSDWTRVHNGTYSEAVRFVLETDRLDRDEKAALLGKSLRRVFGWPAVEQRTAVVPPPHNTSIV